MSVTRPVRRFLIGVLSQLSGTPRHLRMRDIRFHSVTRETVDDLMQRLDVQLQITVPDFLFGNGQIDLRLKFSRLSDFSPAAVAAQLPSLDEARKLAEQVRMHGASAGEPVTLSLPRVLDDAVPAALERLVIAQQDGCSAGSKTSSELAVELRSFLSRIESNGWRERYATATLLREIQTRAARQIVAIQSHPEFKRLMSGWCGLTYLLNQVHSHRNVEVRVLDVDKAKLANDFERSLEFDQTALFARIYGDALDTPGATPFSILIGDYAFGPHRDDVDFLSRCSNVAAATWTPFVTAASPAFFGLKQFSELHSLCDLSSITKSPQFMGLRETFDSQFVALCLPEVWVPLPGELTARGALDTAASEPSIPESVSCNPSFAVAAWLACSQLEDGWCVPSTDGDRGVLHGLAAPRERDETGRRVVKLPVEVEIDDDLNLKEIQSFVQARELAQHGFLPICRLTNEKGIGIRTLNTLARPRLDEGTESGAVAQAWLAGTLEYLMPLAAIAQHVSSTLKCHRFRTDEDLELAIKAMLQDCLATSSGETGRFPFVEATASSRESYRGWSTTVELKLGPHTVDPDQILRLQVHTPKGS